MSTSSKATTTVQPLGIVDGVFLVFLAGKLYGSLDWSWWWVFSPYLVSLVFLLLGRFADGK